MVRAKVSILYRQAAALASAARLNLIDQDILSPFSEISRDFA